MKSHKATSTRTMFSHLLKHLHNHAHFSLSDTCRWTLCRYLGMGAKNEPVKQAKIFTIESIEALYKSDPTTIPQIRDKLYFAFGICTLARSSELSSMLVEDLTLEEKGVSVVLHRKKAAVSRATQKKVVLSSLARFKRLS